MYAYGALSRKVNPIIEFNKLILVVTAVSWDPGASSNQSKKTKRFIFSVTTLRWVPHEHFITDR